MYNKCTILELLSTFNYFSHFRVPNAKAGRDNFDTNIYGMEGVPAEVIEERLNYKMKKKRMKLEKDLLRMGINIDDPKFNISDYEIADPRPPKKKD